jgi:hypothetical protein
MIFYDFVKKQAVDVLASVTHFVDHNNSIGLDTPKPSKCKIVHLFKDTYDGGNLFVARPIELLGKVCIKECNQENVCGGKIYINGNTRRFSIHGDILYIGSTPC